MAAGLRSVFASGFFSFPKGTLIWTEDGFKPIEQITVGDLVWSRDESDPDGKNVLNRVTETFNRITSDMNVLTLKTNTIDEVNGLTLVSSESVGQTHEVRLTPEHPVYVINRYGEEIGWTMATNLVAGDLIADIDGGEAVKVVANALTQTSEKVYNFEVEGNHNYFADELGLWVHNTKGGKMRSPPNVPQHVTDEIREALRKLNKSNPGCSVGEEQDLINAIAKKHNQGKDKIKSLEKFLIRGIRGKNKR